MALHVSEGWAALGACVGYREEHGTERWERDWFPERGTHNYSRARKVCAECPVKQQCLDYAITNLIKHGMWGGTTENERRKIRAGLQVTPRRAEGRKLQPCGTYAAYRRHLAYGQDPCALCRQARARQKREQAANS